jgi:hypothetical protein
MDKVIFVRCANENDAIDLSLPFRTIDTAIVCPALAMA